MATRRVLAALAAVALLAVMVVWLAGRGRDGGAGAAATLPKAALMDTFEGRPALAGATDRVAGRLVVRETGPLRQKLTFEMSNRGDGSRITAFDESHTQQLHVIAVSSDLSQFVHEHVEKAARDGTLIADVTFPTAGLYHVYADVTPRGIGQQVLRFDVPVGGEGSGDTDQAGALSLSPHEVSAGPYTVRIDPSALRAGQSGEMRLSILRNGQPASDLAPYLGAGAHAVLVAADDLSFVHVHPDAHGDDAEAGGHAHSSTDRHGQRGMDHSGHGAHGAKRGDAVATGSVSAEMALHVEPPRPGRYAMWVEFSGGSEVRRASFVIDVPN